MATSIRGTPGDLVVRVARRLADARRARGLTQENLAALLGIAAKNLQRIESGKQNLSLETIERICVALDVSAESILGGGASPLVGAGAHSKGPDANAAAMAHVRREPPSVLDRLEGAGFPVRKATERGRRPANATPVTTLSAAGGYLTGTARAIEVIGWALLPHGRGAEGQFVAEVRGHSMEPRVPSGSLCLFVPPGPPPFGERIFLVAHESMVDVELGGPYALKRIGATRRLPRGGARVTLESIHPSFAPLVIRTHEDDELRVVAELSRVLVRGDRARADS